MQIVGMAFAGEKLAFLPENWDQEPKLSKKLEVSSVTRMRDILCLGRRFSKQNSVICQKSNILIPPKIFCPPPNFWAGYATGNDFSFYQSVFCFVL